MRFAIRVKPGASRENVGGRYQGVKGDELIVAVSARAADGKANQAVIIALAKALDIPRRDINIVIGQTARSKIVEVPDSAHNQVNQLFKEN